MKNSVIPQHDIPVDPSEPTYRRQDFMRADLASQRKIQLCKSIRYNSNPCGYRCGFEPNCALTLDSKSHDSFVTLCIGRSKPPTVPLAENIDTAIRIIYPDVHYHKSPTVTLVRLLYKETLCIIQGNHPVNYPDLFFPHNSGFF